MVEFVDVFGECALLYGPHLKADVLATTSNWKIFLKHLMDEVDEWTTKEGCKTDLEQNSFLMAKTKKELMEIGYPESIFNSMQVADCSLFGTSDKFIGDRTDSE